MTHSAEAPGSPDAHFKDAILERLARTANVAQFASFGPGSDPPLRYVRIGGYEPEETRSAGMKELVRALLERSMERSVNIRSFDPYQPKAHEFLYGVTALDSVIAAVRRLAKGGLYTIVNETIDVGDGGVSGVAYGGMLEFAPGDTPRCVEKPGTVMLPRGVGMKVLETVYGVRPLLEYPENLRVEFSIHPLKRGHRNGHTVIWEIEESEDLNLASEIAWPNLFSRFVGDKAFGLLMADAVDLPVPLTTVIGRRVAPFKLGRPTGSAEIWIRTCPVEPVPGRFTTRRGWLDPFHLMASEDPGGGQIASLLAQQGVQAVHSGASLVSAQGEILVEGVAGTGEAFMLGRMPPERLPNHVVSDVRSVHTQAARQLGAVRFEWAHDGRSVWVIQLHRGITPTAGRVIYPGHPKSERRFRVEDGLEALRELVEQVQGSNEGIVLLGSIGVTSHMGDILRRARIPSRIELRDS